MPLLHLEKTCSDDALNAIALDGATFALGHRQTDPIDQFSLGIGTLESPCGEILENAHRHISAAIPLSARKSLAVQMIFLDCIRFHGVRLLS